METGTAVAQEVTRLRDLKVGVRDLIMLRPQDIQIENGHNPRDYTLPENRQHLDELKASIKSEGTIQPLWVRFDPATKTAILVDGECRLRANLELIAEGVPIEAVPTIQVKGGDEAQRLILALTANTGKPLSKWESGQAFTRLTNMGWTVESISNKLGYTPRFVQEAIELGDAPQEVKQLLSSQAVTPSLALQQLRENGSAAVERLKEAAAKAQGEGRKTATRGVERTIPNPKVMLKLISELVAGIEGDLFAEDEYKFIEVPTATVKKLAKLVGIVAPEGK